MPGAELDLSDGVLILLTRMNIGGPARQVIELARHLGGRMAVRVAAGEPSPEEGELTDPDVPVQRVPLVRPLSPAADASALRACRRLIERTRPAVLHTHMAKAGAVGRAAALSLPKAARPALVHTFHGHVLEGYFGKAQQTAFLAVERFLAARTDRILAVSPEIRDELLGLGIGRPEQYSVVPLGLNLDKMLRVGPRRERGQLRKRLGLTDAAKLAVCAGRLVPIKDHATLLRALALVPDLHLAVLGDGELRPSLQELALVLGVSDRAHFVGWWMDMAGAMCDADLVVLSSRNEGTPMVLIEALAAGRPVVATDVGGASFVVEDGRTGWLCSPGDEASLAQRMRSTLSDPARSAAMAQLGRSVVVERFSLDRAVAAHWDVYRELRLHHR